MAVVLPSTVAYRLGEALVLTAGSYTHLLLMCKNQIDSPTTEEGACIARRWVEVGSMSIGVQEHGNIGKNIVTKNPHAVALGRLGGKKGGPARAKALDQKALQECARKGGKARMEKLSPAERTEVGRKAVRARWDKVKRNTP